MIVFCHGDEHRHGRSRIACTALAGVVRRTASGSCDRNRRLEPVASCAGRWRSPRSSIPTSSGRGARGALAEAEEEAPASTAGASQAPGAQRNGPVICLPAADRGSNRAREHTLPLRLRRDGHRRRSHRAARHRAQLRVIVTVRPKYACRACEEGVTQAPAPARLIEGALPTEGCWRMSWCRSTRTTSRCIASRRSSPARASMAAPFDPCRLGRQGVVPATAWRREVGEARDGRDHGSGSRTGPGQDQDGLHVDDGSRRAAVVRRGPAGCRVSLCARRGGKYGEKLLEGFSGRWTDGYSGNRLRRSDRPDGALTLAACCPTRPDSNGRRRSGTDRPDAIEEKIRGEPPARARRSAGRNRS